VDLERMLPGMVRVDSGGNILASLQLPVDLHCIKSTSTIQLQYPCNTTVTSVALQLTMEV
jgi:hypothetical protein